MRSEHDPAPLVPPQPQGGGGAAALYLHGLSSLDFVPARAVRRRGLSASVITRLSEQWQAERKRSGKRDLSEVD